MKLKIQRKNIGFMISLLAICYWLVLVLYAVLIGPGDVAESGYMLVIFGFGLIIQIFTYIFRILHNKSQGRI